MSNHKGMKLLEIDIETVPALAAIFGAKTRFVTPDKILERGYTCCFCARWHHQQKIMFFSEWEDGRDTMIEKAHELLDQADAVIHYNGKKFDIPTLNYEFVLREMHPPMKYKHIDLYTTVYNTFNFMYNSMDEVAKELGITPKAQTKGMALWKGVMNQEPWAQREMNKYNRGDIVTLRELYEYLRPWITNHPNLALYIDNENDPVCPYCLSPNVVSKGAEYPAQANAYQRYKCKDCGANPRGRKIIKRTDPDKVLRT